MAVEPAGAAGRLGALLGEPGDSSRPAAAHCGRRAIGERARLAAEILAAYLRAGAALRRAPIEQVVAKLRAAEADGAAYDGDALREAVSLGWAVVRTLAWIPGDTRCLRRSLVLTELLARRGIPARLVIAARTEPDFLAHAWVEHEGTPVLSPADDSYGRLVEL